MLQKINKFSFMKITKGFGTNSSPRPTGQKEGICRARGKFLSALKGDFFLRQFDENQSGVNNV